MDPITIIAMASASMAFLKEAIPQIKEMANRGEVSKEDQQKISDEYKSLVRKAGGEFSGPEWDSSGR